MNTQGTKLSIGQKYKVPIITFNVYYIAEADRKD